MAKDSSEKSASDSKEKLKALREERSDIIARNKELLKKQNTEAVGQQVIPGAVQQWREQDPRQAGGLQRVNTPPVQIRARGTLDQFDGPEQQHEGAGQ